MVKNANTMIAISMVLRAQLVQQCKYIVRVLRVTNIYVSNRFQSYQFTVEV
jgi:hypothetical protein